MNDKQEFVAAMFFMLMIIVALLALPISIILTIWG